MRRHSGTYNLLCEQQFGEASPPPPSSLPPFPRPPPALAPVPPIEPKPAVPEKPKGEAPEETPIGTP